MAQNQEIEFEVYTTSAAKASQYLLADDVALRDCPSAQCEQLTTLNIGTYVRLLAKTEHPQTINGVCSRWYKVKIGPQIGWIWGGLIAQKTMVSSIDPGLRFLFGEAGEDTHGQQQYQIRAVKNGVEMDKVVFQASGLSTELVTLDTRHEAMSSQDLIHISPDLSEDFFILWEQDRLKLLHTDSVYVTEASDAYFAQLIEE
jgi:hypothetical protein